MTDICAKNMSNINRVRRAFPLLSMSMVPCTKVLHTVQYTVPRYCMAHGHATKVGDDSMPITDVPSFSGRHMPLRSSWSSTIRGCRSWLLTCPAMLAIESHPVLRKTIVWHLVSREPSGTLHSSYHGLALWYCIFSPRDRRVNQQSTVRNIVQVQA